MRCHKQILIDAAADSKAKEELPELAEKIVWAEPCPLSRNVLERLQVQGAFRYTWKKPVMFLESNFDYPDGERVLAGVMPLADHKMVSLSQLAGSHYFDHDTVKVFDSKILDRVMIRGTGVVLYLESIRGHNKQAPRIFKIIQPTFFKRDFAVQVLMKWAVGATTSARRTKAKRVFDELKRVIMEADELRHTPQATHKELKLLIKNQEQVIKSIPLGLS